MKLRGWMISLALLLAACGGAGTDSLKSTTAAADDSPEIVKAELGAAPNVTRFGSIWFAGQPGPDDWKAAKEKGIKHVIDLRNRSESRGHDEKTMLEGLNLEYHIYPVRAEEYSKATVEPVLAAMTRAQESGEGLLVHCASSNRSGALFAIWRHRRGDSVEDAISAGKQAGMTSEEAAAREYIDEHGR